MSNAYTLAGKVVAGVLEGQSLSRALPALLDGKKKISGPVRAAVRDLAFGALRHYFFHHAVLRRLMPRPAKEPAIDGLLLCALADLSKGEAPEHSVVNEAVAGAPLWARPLVNGVLRNFLRRRRELGEEVRGADEEARYGLPAWWLARLKEQYGDAWTELALASLDHPPFGLRVNLRRGGLADYLGELAAAGLQARGFVPAGVLLERALPVERLPGFAEGRVSVQDMGAQRAAEILGLADGQRVLDACAAPGGKSGHILEKAAVDLLALDHDEDRLARVEENLTRLGLSASLAVGNAADPMSWWDGRPFERILLDVPCSASGVVRRNPDIRLLRRPSDLAGLAADQGRMLAAVWSCLAHGGKLLYATCSVFRDENDDVVEGFLHGRDDARLELRECLAPGLEHDGFYYALLAKG